MKRLKEGSVRKISGTQYFIVDSPFYWIVDWEKPNDYIIMVEKNFRTNFGSIPRFFRIFFDPTKYNSYVLHDWLYSDHMKYHKSTDSWDSITRKESDYILLQGLAYEGASTIEKLCIYTAVRLFGWISWEN